MVRVENRRAFHHQWEQPENSGTADPDEVPAPPAGEDDGRRPRTWGRQVVAGFPYLLWIGGYYLGIALQINDRNPVPWYLLARASARLNDIDDTFEALARAFDSGFRDLVLTQEDPAFARVKSRAEFARFVAAMVM